MAAALPTTVRADSVDWPFATFLDAYGYHRVDRFRHPVLDRCCQVLTVDVEGQLRRACEAHAVDWHGTLAWRAADDRFAPELCFLCGTSGDADDVCQRCRDDAEPY